MSPKMQFVDLFAGLGGFHIALRKLGHRCVFACEINENLAKLYEENFKIEIKRDIRTIEPKEIPSHNILCAGFPCQPFSKAGHQSGLNDKKNGNLFNYIARILKYHKPAYFILENVPHIEMHENSETWEYMRNTLSYKLKYNIKHDVFSPHEFGIPQHRERIFIVGARRSLSNFEWPNGSSSHKTDINEILEKNPSDANKIGKRETECINLWQDFIDKIPQSEQLPSFPIWSMEFDATYPFEKTTPHVLSPKQLSKYQGCFGEHLKFLSKEKQFEKLPSYARTAEAEFPDWKKEFIRKNREFLSKYKKEICPIIRKIQALGISSWQKFEWNCKNDERKIWKHLIQFRASGVRVKRTDFAPSLVCTPTQVPIIGWEKRYLTKREGARLQSLNGIKLPEIDSVCSRALGNAVNVHIVYLIAKNLIE